MSNAPERSLSGPALRRRTLGSLAACTAVLALLTGCEGDLKPGPAGRVVAKDKDTYAIHHPKVGTSPAWTEIITEYFLTTSRRFEVSESDYKDCYQGSAYPRCTER